MIHIVAEYPFYEKEREIHMTQITWGKQKDSPERSLEAWCTEEKTVDERGSEVA